MLWNILLGVTGLMKIFGALPQLTLMLMNLTQLKGSAYPCKCESLYQPDLFYHALNLQVVHIIQF